MSDCKHDWQFWADGSIFVCSKCQVTISAVAMAQCKKEAWAENERLKETIKQLNQDIMSLVNIGNERYNLLRRIQAVAIHTPQGNAVIPSSMILDVKL